MISRVVAAAGLAVGAGMLVAPSASAQPLNGWNEYVSYSSSASECNYYAAYFQQHDKRLVYPDFYYCGGDGRELWIHWTHI
ncbi:hypothetical protein ACIBAC_40660 [Streptomyces sp. NPDC051362]|uniref:hypothetical protein n=1 Tax=Streptomyces sp. NPDC051362 TaxID=3365651 RepID=UPI00378A4235